MAFDFHNAMGGSRAAARRVRRGILLLLILVLQAVTGLWHRPHGDVFATPLAFTAGEANAVLAAARAPDCAGCPHDSAGHQAAADCDLCRLHQQPRDMVPAVPRLAESNPVPRMLIAWAAPAIDRSLNLSACGPRGPPA